MQIEYTDYLALKKLVKSTPPGETFVYKGETLLQNYAVYLLEHIENQTGWKEHHAPRHDKA